MDTKFADKVAVLNLTVLNSFNAATEKDIIKKFVETGIKVLNADFGYCFINSEISNKFELLYVSEGSDYVPITTPRKNGLISRAFKSQKPVFVEDVTKAAQVRYDAKKAMRGAVVIPISYKNDNYGALVFSFKKSHVFVATEKTLCTFIGNSAAQAITISRLYSNLRNFKDTLDNTLDSIFIFDSESLKLTYANKGAYTQLGYLKKELYKKSILDIQSSKVHERFKEAIVPLLNAEASSVLFETLLVSKSGSKFPAEFFLQYIKKENTKPRFLVIARDITDRKKAEETIKQTAYQDTLTKLPNRLFFNERIAEAYAFSKRNKKNFALILMDLDRFKFINDILGHIIGDKVLHEAGQRLRASVKKGDFVGRLGGDEFVVLLESIGTEEEVLLIAQRIQEAFRTPFNLDGHEIYVNNSFGISIYPDDGKDIPMLLKNADSALYRAKEQGGNSFQQYSEESGIMIQSSHYEIEKGLRKALKNNELAIQYQPQIDIKSGRIIGCEALLRWNHPQLGLISPGEFITQAEESSLIIPIGEWVLEEACKQNKLWQDAGLAYIPVSVNVSPKQLLQKSFVDTMHRVLKETELDPHYLELEIIEGVVMKNIDMSIEILRQFKDMGIKVLVDDFGTGYASLSYLKRLPIDAVKIDKSFIDGSLVDSDDAALVVAIISIAHQLRLKVIAEGVETSNQFNFLASHNCDYIQGYLYSRPLSVDEFTKLLKTPKILPNVGSKQYTIEK